MIPSIIKLLDVLDEVEKTGCSAKKNIVKKITNPVNQDIKNLYKTLIKNRSIDD